MHRLTGFQRDLLTVIKGLDQPSGQTVRNHLEEQRKQKITHGRLYPNLDVIVSEGLVEKGNIDRRTNYYAISDTGQQALESYYDWFTQQVESR
ncbi:helix-turn-helix transcriptional regulator [Halomarina salina]|uniref:Helix-turn-helix transcriptional regulator n=1 Tax=Halomarina salina TaxID=1872699 RepID=A0ABD5RPA5_9EURY